VQAYGWFQDAKSVFIAMEYFPLGDLQARMKNSPPFGEEVTRQIVRQLLDGASLMHRNSYAHRDLKPAVCYFLFHHGSVVLHPI
jgi:serine/threonine protein kinase